MSGELLRVWGANIKELRESDRVGKTREQFAEAVGVSVATVSRWENGLMTPSDAHKLEIAYALGADVRLIFPLVRIA